MGALSDELFGVSTRAESFSRTTTVGTSAGQIAPQNPNRTLLTLVNPTTEDIWVLDDPEVTTGEGFILPPENGTLTFTIGEDGDLVQAEFHAIAANGSNNIVRRAQVARGEL